MAKSKIIALIAIVVISLSMLAFGIWSVASTELRLIPSDNQSTIVDTQDQITSEEDKIIQSDTKATEYDYSSITNNCNFYYTISSNEITITECYSATGISVIPSSINGYPVTKIGYRAFTAQQMTSIYIPSSVKHIGEYAFYDCGNLTTVTIAGGVTSMDNGAFIDCDKLANVTLQEGITVIGASMFNGCSSLTKIFIPDSVTKIESNAFQNTNLQVCRVGTESKLTSIGEAAFAAKADVLDLILFCQQVPTLNLRTYLHFHGVGTVNIYVLPTLYSTYRSNWSYYESKIQNIPQYTLTWDFECTFDGYETYSEDVYYYAEFDDGDYEDDNSYDIDHIIPERRGYNFLGYFSGANGTGTQYYDSSNPDKVFYYDVKGPLTIYAYWGGKKNMKLNMLHRRTFLILKKFWMKA